jgi:hypothetical protein
MYPNVLLLPTLWNNLLPLLKFYYFMRWQENGPIKSIPHFLNVPMVELVAK